MSSTVILFCYNRSNLILKESDRMRADRLISILLLLQNEGKMSSRQLAERLEVSVRTIVRDMEALSMAGVPVYAERGSGGGWRLPDGYRTRLTGIRSEELTALILSTHPQLLADLRIESHFHNAMQKLLASSPAPIKENAELFRRRIHIDGAGWHRSTETCPHLLTVQEALFANRLLRIRYEYDMPFPEDGEQERRESERVVQPLGLVAKRTVWYLVAARERDGAEQDGMGEIRTYRVSRIAHAEVLDETVPYPDFFHLARYWEESTARFKQSIPRYVARLRLDPIVRKQWEQQPFLEILETGAVEEDGRLPATVQFATLDHAVNMVLGFGPAVAVLDPPELREAVIAAAKATLEQYAGIPHCGCGKHP
jgi:predicted DNA-binding transcriptional regulator YafY